MFPIGSLCLGTAGVVFAHVPAPVKAEGSVMHTIGFPGGGMALEAGVAIAATALRWLRGLIYPEDYPTEGLFDRMLEEAEQSPVGANCVTFIPHLIGAVCPVNDPAVRSTFTGMSLGTRRCDLIRATIEGVCYEMRDMLEACRAMGVSDFGRLRAIGGACRSDFWNQMLADVTGCPVETVSVPEAPSLGVAVTSAVGAGLYGSMREACERMIHVKRRYEPDPEAVRLYNDYYDIYLSAINDLRREAFPKLAALREREGI